MCVWKARIEYFINDLLWPTTIWKINTNNTRREKQLGKESASTERKRSLCTPSSSAAQRRGSCVRSGRRQQLPLHQYRQRQSNRRLTSTCCTISTPPSQAYPYRRSSLFLFAIHLIHSAWLPRKRCRTILPCRTHGKKSWRKAKCSAYWS